LFISYGANIAFRKVNSSKCYRLVNSFVKNYPF
jgi:hypothetical protein